MKIIDNIIKKLKYNNKNRLNSSNILNNMPNAINGVVLGIDPNTENIVRDNSDEHILILSPVSELGIKKRKVIFPTLLDWKESMIILDINGEAQCLKSMKIKIF